MVVVGEVVWLGVGETVVSGGRRRAEERIGWRRIIGFVDIVVVEEDMIRKGILFSVFGEKKTEITWKFGSMAPLTKHGEVGTRGLAKQLYICVPC